MFLGNSHTLASPTLDSEPTDKSSIIPHIIYDRENPTEIKALIYDNGKNTYYFSNDEGHKVYSNDNRSCRPMTKREFKKICTDMLENSRNYMEIEELILSEIEKLDFSIGHANSTFEIIKSHISQNRIGTLTLNIGTARYLYNQDTNTVFHIDHNKLINGTMMKSPEKDKIIKKITTSKTMTKKINQIINI